MSRHWKLVDEQDYQHIDKTGIDNNSENDAQQLEKGSKVKLAFIPFDADLDTQHTELLWVEILLVQDEKYLGQLADEPNRIKCLARGELIEFETRHIIGSEYIDPFNSSIKV